METKVIEQEDRHSLEISFNPDFDEIEIEQETMTEFDLIIIEKSKAKEVALAICPYLTKQIEEQQKEIERLKSNKYFVSILKEIHAFLEQEQTEENKKVFSEIVDLCHDITEDYWMYKIN